MYKPELFLTWVLMNNRKKSLNFSSSFQEVQLVLVSVTHLSRIRGLNKYRNNTLYIISGELKASSWRQALYLRGAGSSWVAGLTCWLIKDGVIRDRSYSSFLELDKRLILWSKAEIEPVPGEPVLHALSWKCNLSSKRAGFTETAQRLSLANWDNMRGEWLSMYYPR